MQTKEQNQAEGNAIIKEPKPQKARDTNIELLRIISMLGVVILHIVNSSMGGGLLLATKTESVLAMNLLEACFVCAVNVYVLISGYYLSINNRRNIVKALELFALVIALQLFGYLLGDNNCSVLGVLNCLIPSNWFVMLYVGLYFISPFLNIVIEKLSKKQYLWFLIIIVLFFSLYPTLIDLIESLAGIAGRYGTSTISMQGSQSGYTIVNFVLIYFIGGFLRKFGLENYKKRYVLLLFVVFVLATLGWLYLDFGSGQAYCNPLVIFEAVTIFIFFKKLNLPNLKPILWFSAASFMVYLTHIYLLKYVPIDLFANSNFFIVIFSCFLAAMAIYLVGFIINLVYTFTIKLVFKRLAKIKLFQVDFL